MLKKWIGKLRPKAKPKARAKPSKGRKPAARAKRAGPKKTAPLTGPDAPIGEVVAFFRIPVAAVIKVTQGSLKAGDSVWIKGHTTDLKQTLTSLQINHQPIQEAKKGQEAGVKVSARVRRGDRVYRL